MQKSLLPPLDTPSRRPAVIAAGTELGHGELARVSGRLAQELVDGSRVAIWATPTVETCVAMTAALRAGATVVPINPGAGTSELDHLLKDSDPKVVLHAPGDELPPILAGKALPISLELASGRGFGDAGGPVEAPADAPALILYTSGTTGPPKGVVISRGALAADLDGLAEVWQWTRDDVVAHALPLHHAHGLVLGVLGPLRLGGTAMLLGRFDPAAAAAALRGPATMLFGVPTMYRRLRLAAEDDPEIARGLARARLLISGSAALPATEHAAIERICGQRIVERYGMTETLIVISARADGRRQAGAVGHPVPGVEIRLVDDGGRTLTAAEPDVIGEVQVRGPTVFSGYLGLAEATEKAFDEGWFRSGDLATRDLDGTFRIIGRRATDLIKTGGYRVGAGEIESALMEHPGIAEVAVTGEPDADLGERIVAWIVTVDGDGPSPSELTEHATRLLSAHKRPRDFHYIERLPRNPVGKVVKGELSPTDQGPPAGKYR